MKIHLTKKEYRLLLEMLAMAEWVMESRPIKSADECKEHSLVAQKILSYGKDFRCEDLIEHDKVGQKYYQNILEDDDSTVVRIVGEYEKEVFWDALTENLARRDLLFSMGSADFAKLDPMERFNAILDESEKYHEEFENYGIRNLHIVAVPDKQEMDEDLS